MFILTLFPHSFTYNLKSDTCGPVIDFNFNNRTLILILMATHMAHQYQSKLFEHVFNCQKRVLNLNYNSH